MRRSLVLPFSFPVLLGPLAMALVHVASPALGQVPAHNGLGAALHELEIARLQFRLYERVDYPLRLRQLDSEVKLAQAEVESLRRRAAQYQRFDDSTALFVTRENTRLQLLEAELRLKNLKEERLLLQIHNKDERRLRQLLIQRAESQVEALR